MAPKKGKYNAPPNAPRILANPLILRATQIGPRKIPVVLGDFDAFSVTTGNYLKAPGRQEVNLQLQTRHSRLDGLRLDVAGSALEMPRGGLAVGGAAAAVSRSPEIVGRATRYGAVVLMADQTDVLRIDALMSKDCVEGQHGVLTLSSKRKIAVIRAGANGAKSRISDVLSQ